MVPVGGVPLIDRMIQRIGEAGIHEVVVVSGHCQAALAGHLAASADPLARAARVVFNNRYAEWGNFYSLLVAEPALAGGAFVKLDGDVLLGPDVLPALLDAPGPAVIAVDTSVKLGAEEMKVRVDGAGRAVALNKRMPPGEALGESIGIERIDPAMAPALWAELRAMIAAGETDEYYERAYERLMTAGHGFTCADVSASLWFEIDDAADLERANRLVADRPC
jgi:choline kinase